MKIRNLHEKMSRLGVKIKYKEAVISELLYQQNRQEMSKLGQIQREIGPLQSCVIRTLASSSCGQARNTMQRL